MALKSTLGQYIADFISLVYPRLCPGCSRPMIKGETGICVICRHEISKTDYHLDIDNQLAKRFYGRLPVEAALAYLFFAKGGITQQLLHQIKYDGNKDLGRLLGEWYGMNLKEDIQVPWDVIVPVPLHEAKKKKRGYNQSDCFAEGLSNALAIPWNPAILSRIEATETQTNKSKEERWENVRNKFVVVDQSAIAEKHVLIVDDVITTGSTIEACGSALLQAGVGEMSVAALAVPKAY